MLRTCHCKQVSGCSTRGQSCRPERRKYGADHTRPDRGTSLLDVAHMAPHHRVVFLDTDCISDECEEKIGGGTTLNPVENKLIVCLAKVLVWGKCG